MGASRLVVNLHAIKANYRYLDQCSSSETSTGAAVKSNGYGLGMKPISKTLYDSGCRRFFVAQLSEGIDLRQALADKPCQIFVLEGPNSPELSDYKTHDLIPVLNSADQIDHVVRFNRTQPAPLSSAVHIDTGMSRLGLDQSGLAKLQQITSDNIGFRLELVISHLACADEPDHKLNFAQLKNFTKLPEHMKNIPRSLSNTAGILLDSAYHFDVTRPGIGLYGVEPRSAVTNQHLQPAITWQADILQIRTIEKGKAAGYGAQFIARKRTKLATIGVGYADGYARNLYNPEHAKIAVVGIAGHPAPLAGRVSMDLAVVDVSSVPDAILQKTRHAALIWDGYRLEQMAAERNTIAYEVLTGLGVRVKRHYDES